MRKPDRYFTLLLRLLPALFRDRHREELIVVWDQIKEDLGPSPGRLAILRLYLTLTWDVVWQAAVSHSGAADHVRIWQNGLWADSRFALRQYARRWGTTLTMLVILSLGMSISVLLFSFAHSYALLPPPGIALEDDLVRIRGSAPFRGGRLVRAFKEDEFLEYRRLDDHFAAVAGWTHASTTVSVPDYEGSGAVTAAATFVTENYFSVLGVRPMMGPGLPTVQEGDPTLESVAVIGHIIWVELFAQNPDVIGSRLEVNGTQFTVVGVAPPRFVGIGRSDRFRLWLPLSKRHDLLPPSSVETLAYRSVARLHPGMSRSEATAAVQVVAHRTAVAKPSDAINAQGPSAEVVPLLSANGDPNFDNDVKLLILALGGLGVLTLLVVCTNVGALLMSLAVARRHEIVVRLSLGAARSRVIRQLLTESALLASVAGAAALGIVWLVLRLLDNTLPLSPFDLGITWPATAFTFTTALAVGMLFGLAPALHSTRLSVAGALQDSASGLSGGRLRLHRTLVAAQVAFTQPLAVGIVAILLVAFGSMRPAGPSEFGEQLISLQLIPATVTPGGQISTQESRRELRGEMSRLLAALESIPGVAAAIFDSQRLGDLGSYTVYSEDRVPDGFGESFRLDGRTAAPGLFSVMGVPLLRGREFAPGDASVGDLVGNGQPIPVVIGGDLARRLWPGTDALGQRLQATASSVSPTTLLVVTGVLAEPEGGAVRVPESSPIYLNRDTANWSSAILVRTKGKAQPVIATVRRVARDAAPGMSARVQTVASIERDNRRVFRRVIAAAAVTGLLALFLSAIGLYAVMALTAGQRASEIAVRMAIGARSGNIARAFLFDGFRLGVIGLCFGLPLSLAGLGMLNAIIVAEEGIRVPVMEVGVAVAFAVVLTAAAAPFIPAQRAASVDPARMLRRA